GCQAEPVASLDVPTNAAGWPLKTYVVYAGTLGPGTRSMGHNVAYGIISGGWKQYVDEQVQPLLNGPNPPARLVLHCVGPAWPRVRDGEPRFDRSGGIQRWFEYDWPLSVSEGREREDGRGRWPPLPQYVDDFAATWQAVASGERSDGFPIETYAYTGMIQTPWLESLRESDQAVYRNRLVRVARFFDEAGFAGIYVDAAAAQSLPADHIGLKTLREIDAWPDFFVGVEAYPPSKHDSATGPLPYFISHVAVESQHPGFPSGPRRSWQSQLDRKGLVVWHNTWGGGAYRLTPETAQLTAAAGDEIGVSWVRWKELAPQLPPQQVSPISVP
ncbi:MAG: hypothetical protein AAF266_16385, partial [Planctomycetota bacterium]